MEDFILTDYFFVFLLIVSTLFGFARGFIRELFTVFNLLLAVYATYFLFPSAYDFFAGHFQDEKTIWLASVVTMFTISWVIVAIINSFVLDALGGFKGGSLDRLLGTAFGVFRGAMIIIAIYIGTVITVNAQLDEERLPAWLKDAGSYNYVKMQSEYVISLAPKEIQDAYYSDDGETLTGMLGNISTRTEHTEAEKKLLEMGFTVDNINTLRKIHEDLPSSYSATLTADQITELDTEYMKLYGDELVDDYMAALMQGRVEPNISKQSLESLKSAFQALPAK